MHLQYTARYIQVLINFTNYAQDFILRDFWSARFLICEIFDLRDFWSARFLFCEIFVSRDFSLARFNFCDIMSCDIFDLRYFRSTIFLSHDIFVLLDFYRNISVCDITTAIFWRGFQKKMWNSTTIFNRGRFYTKMYTNECDFTQ